MDYIESGAYGLHLHFYPVDILSVFDYHLLTGKSDTKQNDGIHAVFFHLSIRPDEII